MSLEVDLIACSAVFAVEEVVETDLVERSRACKGREVAADAVRAGVGSRHHHRRVPPDVGADSPFDVLITGELGLFVG